MAHRSDMEPQKVIAKAARFFWLSFASPMSSRTAYSPIHLKQVAKLDVWAV